MQLQIVEVMMKMVGKLFLLGNLFCLFINSASISPKNQNYYVGGTALVEINLVSGEEIIGFDQRLVQTDKVIVNKFINGQFVKNYLYRFEVVLKYAGSFKLEPFLIKTINGNKKIEINAIDVLVSPQELNTVGARLTADLCQALVGQKVNLVYEIIFDHDHKIINYELADFAKNIDILAKSENKNGNKIRIEFQVVFKNHGSFSIPKIVVATAKNNSISQLLGFGKTFVSNDLTIEVLETQDIFLFIEQPEEMDVKINQQITESDILTLSGNNYFLNWPSVKVVSGQANIYNSEIKNTKDQSFCKFVVQPLANGKLSLNISGKAYDKLSKKYINLTYLKNIEVNLINQQISNSIVVSSKNIEQQKINWRDIILKRINYSINWYFWYLTILILSILNIYIIYGKQFLSKCLMKIKNLILVKYYAGLLELAFKKNDLMKRKILAKKLINLKICDQQFLNKLRDIIYNN